MDLKDFYAGMDNLKRWFKKSHTDTQDDMWFEKVKDIPFKAFLDIIDTIQDSEKFFPTPDKVKKLYTEWKSNNPHLMRQEHESTPCDECEGKGYITAWKQPNDLPGFIVNGKPNIYLAKEDYPCSACQNWKNAFPTKGPLRPRVFVTREVLKAKGMFLEDPCFDESNKPKKNYKNIDEMAGDIGFPF